jgi:hypothetical protein
MAIEVEFYCKDYEPFLPESSQVNPERYGAELAWWLCQKLAIEGVHTSYPNFENWGWFLEYINDDNEYWLCIGNIDSREHQWRMVLQPQAKRWFGLRRAPIENAKVLLDAVDKVIRENDQISEIKWI